MYLLEYVYVTIRTRAKQTSKKSEFLIWKYKQYPYKC